MTGDFKIEFDVPYYDLAAKLDRPPDGFRLHSWSCQPYKEGRHTLEFTVVYKWSPPMVEPVKQI